MNLPPALKRYTQWLGFHRRADSAARAAGASVPLALRLDQTSDLVHKACSTTSWRAWPREVDYFYRNNAEHVLDLPASVFTQNQLATAALHFKKKGVEGVKRLFVVSFHDGDDRPRYFYPSCATFQPPAWSPELGAVYVASSPWRLLAMKGVPGRARAADSRGRRTPTTASFSIRSPDDSSKLVGLAGMVLDEAYFRFLTCCPWRSPDRSAAFGLRRAGASRLRDRRQGKDRLPPTGSLPNRSMEVEKPFSLVFTDWTIGLASRNATQGLAVARRSFLLNMCLSIALASVLLGGVLLTLRTSSREMKLSRMKNEFVSNVSHELRTPLGLDPRLRRAAAPRPGGGAGEGPRVRRVHRNESRRLSQLINNILDFASIESGRKTYHFERCDVREVVCETLKTFGVRLRQSGFNIHLEGADIPLPPARIDAGCRGRSPYPTCSTTPSSIRTARRTSPSPCAATATASSSR